jgi:flagellar hook-length control protein FliK
MQTSQVTTSANVLSSPSPAARQADNSNSTESFGQVLSREVSERQSTSEAPKMSEPARQQPAAASTKAADAKKPAAEKAKDDGDAQDDTDAVASQAPDDMLALVANLSQIVAPAAKAGDADAKSFLKEDAVAASDPALALAAASMAKPDQAALAAQLPTADGTAVRKTEPALALSDVAADDSRKLVPAVDIKSDTPARAAAADLVAKGQELLSGTAKQTVETDFAAVMKDSAGAVAAVMQPVQHAPMQAAQALASHVDKLTPAVGTPAWDQALGQKVVWMVAGEQQSASLTLNPPDLGPLQVVLSVTNSHASATFTAAQPEVRQALESALPKLREMLGEAGIQLGQASVNSGAPNQQSAFDQQAAPARRDFEGEGRNEGAAQPVRTGRVMPAASGVGLVDTFA